MLHVDLKVRGERVRRGKGVRDLIRKMGKDHTRILYRFILIDARVWTVQTEMLFDFLSSFRRFRFQRFFSFRLKTGPGARLWNIKMFRFVSSNHHSEHKRSIGRSVFPGVARRTHRWQGIFRRSYIFSLCRSVVAPSETFDINRTNDRFYFLFFFKYIYCTSI